MKRWDDESRASWKLFPEHCWFEKATVVTVRNLESAYECVSVCGYIDELAQKGHARVVVDLSEMDKVPGAFFGFMQSLSRRHAKNGTRIIIVGSCRPDADAVSGKQKKTNKE